MLATGLFQHGVFDFIVYMRNFVTPKPSQHGVRSGFKAVNEYGRDYFVIFRKVDLPVTTSTATSNNVTVSPVFRGCTKQSLALE